MTTKHKTKRSTGNGDIRPVRGRPHKPDSGQYGRISCVLKTVTIEALKAGAQSQKVGAFLQWHLDRFPVPSHTEYQAALNRPAAVKIEAKKLPLTKAQAKELRKVLAEERAAMKRLGQTLPNPYDHHRETEPS